MTPRSFIIFYILLILFIGCGSTNTSNLSNRSISFLDVNEVIQKQQTYIRSMKGEGQVSVETSDNAYTLRFTLALLKPDSVLINLKGPFGIKLGSVLLTRNEFVFYNSYDNQLITGSTSAENLNRILSVQLSFDDLLNLFAGGAFNESDLRSPDETLFENDQFVFIYNAYDSSRRYWIDPSTLYIRKVQLLDHSNKLTLEQTFSDFENIEGVLLPYKIRVTQTKGRQMLSLNYSDVQINTSQLQFSFTIPDNVKRIRW
jgi:outer membrane lipoprotein-sorting protein